MQTSCSLCSAQRAVFGYLCRRLNLNCEAHADGDSRFLRLELRRILSQESR